MDNKDKRESFESIDEFNKKYNHYASENEDTEIIPVPEIKHKDSFEDISSHSEVGDSELLYEYEDEASNYDEQDIPNESEMTGLQKFQYFFTKNKYRNTKIIALCLVIAILLSGAGFLVWLYVTTKSKGYGDDGIDFGNIDKDYLSDDDTQFKAMGDIDADSLNAFLYEWANNGGEKMYNKNVLNVLLCGVDSEFNLCDSQILVSIDKKNEKITMVSFLRDSWTYIRMPKEDGTYYDEYEKINAAYHGGPATLKQTLENNYKIKIDQYVVVDFKTFPKVIDAIGGVTVEVQEYETNYIRRTSSQTDFPYGKATLNGKQALIYSRIRHCDDDSDLSRTRRQRSVIKALIESAKTASKGQLVNAFKQVSPYLRTGYSQSEVLSLIATAYSHNWMNFEIKEYIMPNEDYVERIGGYMNSTTWAWTVDYPICAQRLQQILYGQTNIVLASDRVGPFNFVSNVKNTTSDSGNEPNNSGSNYNDYEEPTREEPTGYDEPVTEEPTAEPEEPVTDPVPEEPVTDAPEEDNNIFNIFD